MSANACSLVHPFVVPASDLVENTRTIEIKVYAHEALHEFLIAELADLDFQSFVEGDEYVLAYIRARDWDDVARESVERWQLMNGLPASIEERAYEPENWNRAWEETVRPVVVDSFVIKPTWADLPEDAEGRIVLEIDPKMSFGTGYHESTRLMLKLLPGRVSAGMTVLDAGTGTGVLAIAAAKLGAARVFGFDIDPWSFTNARENVYLNDVADRVTIASGSVEVMPDSTYDVVLANINRSVLIELLPLFQKRLDPAGCMILAGMLNTDRELMLQHAAHCGLKAESEATEGSWWAVVLVHEAN